MMLAGCILALGQACAGESVESLVEGKASSNRNCRAQGPKPNPKLKRRYGDVESLVEGKVSLNRNCKAQYPKPNPELKRRFGAIESYKAAITIDTLRKEDITGFTARKDEIEKLFNLVYATILFDDWTCNARGDIIIFISRYVSGSSGYHVFKEEDGIFKFIGTYDICCDYVRDVPEQFVIESDGIVVTLVYERNKGETGVRRIEVARRFSFSRKEEAFYFLDLRERCLNL